MTSWGKVLLGMALGLPMGAYAVGTLVSSSADEPPPREPIILQEAPSPTQGTTPGVTLSPRPTRDPSSPPPSPRSSPPPPAPPSPEVVVPSYVDRDDDDDDDDDDDRGGDRDDDDRDDDDRDDDGDDD